MSGPERELPPLRVKLIGDGSSYKKMVADAKKDGEDLAQTLSKQAKAHAESLDALVKRAEKGAASRRKELQRRMRHLDKAYSQEIAGIEKTEQAWKKATKSGGKAIDDLSSAIAQGASFADAKVAKSTSNQIKNGTKLRESNIALDQAIKRGMKNASASWNTATARGAKSINSLSMAIAQGAYAAQNAVTKSTNSQIKDATRLREAHVKLDQAIKRGMKSAASRKSGGGGGGGGGRGGYGGLGDRADIYMHQSQIRGIAYAWAGPIKALSEYQSQIAMMTSFVGAGPAKKLVDDLRQSQVGRLYGDEASIAATRFLPLTKDVDKTKKILDQVGNVSGGDAERFQGIARALSQVMSQGYLQGDELEQFAERGFPMTELLAKNLKMSTAEVRKLGEQRRLSSSLILAVMEKETSAGGDYAGTMGLMSEKLGGSITAVKSLYKELQTKVMEAAEKELVSLVKVLGHYLKQVVEWVKNNQEQVRGYVLLAIKITAAVVAFHLLAMAVAYVRWMFYSFAVVATLVTGAIKLIRGAVMGLSVMLALLRGTLTLTQIAFVATWVTALGPVGAVIAGIVLVSTAIWMLISALTHEDGLMGAFTDVWEYTMAFFDWLSEQLGLSLDIDTSSFEAAIASITKAPDVNFRSLLGEGEAKKLKEPPMIDAISVKNQGANERRMEKFRAEYMNSPSNVAKDPVAKNTEKTNEILEKIHKKIGGSSHADAALGFANLVEAM